MCLQLAIMILWLSKRFKCRPHEWPLLDNELKRRNYPLPPS